MEDETKKDARFDLDEAALYFHKYPTPGKLEIQATKPLGNQRDLALAYSPGVAAPCLAIRDDPATAADYTARANLVAVVSNGTAVLGLGNIGPLASKPVMEGKAVLFKKFAGIDVFDIEIDAPDIERMVETVVGAGADLRRHQPRGHQGAGMLRGRGAAEGADGHPGLPRRPARHRDHRRRGGAQRAGACRQEHLPTSRSSPRAPVRRRSPASTSWSRSAPSSRTSGSPTASASPTRAASTRWTAGRTPTSRTPTARTLADVIAGADVFLGLSAAGVLKPELLKDMAPKPLILALANPTPEIMPEVARAARPDAMICTGRSDFPNQVNNVLCFPYIFRGALDCGARAINEEMKMAAVRAIAALAREEPSDVAATRLCRRDADLRARLPDPLALRPAADPAHRAGRRQGRLRQRRRHAADRRLRRLSRPAQPLRLPLRPGHEAGLLDRPRRAAPSASSMPTARTSACCAPRRWCSRKASPSRS